MQIELDVIKNLSNKAKLNHLWMIRITQILLKLAKITDRPWPQADNKNRDLSGLNDKLHSFHIPIQFFLHF